MHAPYALAPTRRMLAAALLALAGVAALSTPGAPLAERTEHPPGHRPAAGDRTTPAPTPSRPGPRAGTERPASSFAVERYRPDPGDPAHPGIPPPHAPGFDDVKTWHDPPPRHAASQPTTSTTVTDVAAAAAAAGAVPWPVLPTSWHNRQLAASLARPAELADAPAAAADFLRSGRLAWWGVQAARAGRPARLMLLDREAGGHWIDVSARLLAGADDARACALPRQVLVADLNRDDRPDLYVVCDGEPHLAWLSRADGRYVRIDTGYAGWAGAAEAGDVDGDGTVDIIAVDDPRAAVLHGRGDGRFDPRPR